jgi:thiamine biosynthesis protein ThiI
MSIVLLVRYAEIHLKGLNRPYFERMLVDRIKDSLAISDVKIVREQGRVFIYDIPQDKIEIAIDKTCKVFGVHSVSPAYCVEKDWTAIKNKAVELMNEYASKEVTFKCFAKRSDKRFPMTSEQICRELGHELLEAYSTLSVDVHHPEVKLTVEVRQEKTFIYTKEYKAVGGMPVGTNGKAMLLISGGIDSPVAGYMIAKRGVALSAVHFYSYPYTSERARDKVVELTRLVSDYAGEIDLYLVPFTEIQLTIYEKCPSSETTVLMRRLMMKIAEIIANKCGAQALITGESIGQVASQTMDSLACTDDAVSLPVFRPLIGFDKEEIVERAQQIRTFETSILPYEDCCTVFVPVHPVTRPKVEQLRKSESLVDFAPMIDKAIQSTEVVKISHIVKD